MWVPAAAQQRASLEDILRRAGIYAQTYHREFTSVVAEEHYVQRVTRGSGGGSGRWPLAGVTDDSEKRTLRSDYMLLRGEPGETAWLSFRDIFEVDGRVVAGERGRLETWLRGSRAGLASRARALALDQARYNVGSLVRTINVPLLPLEFLVPDTQKRMRFRLRAEETILGTQAAVVSYEERHRPTMIRTPEGDDVPADGRFWIEPASGRVLKTELRTGNRNRRQVRTTITVSYERNERLNMLVPVGMEETYFTGSETITGSARYSNYRRFETDARIK
jgi:hypothetical protein